MGSLVTFAAFGVFLFLSVAAGGPNWQKDCDEQELFAAAVE